MLNRPPSRSTPLHDAPLPHSLRWLAGLVVVCLLLQSLQLPAQRTAARLHVHMAPAWAQLWAGAWGDPAAPAIFVHGSGLGRDAAAAHPGAHAHSHAHPAKHDHTGHDGDDIVVLGSAHSEDPASATAVLKRHLFDHDTVGSQPLAWITAVATQTVASVASLHHRSHIEPPLERPPRARG